jgi:HNH endonuclease
MNFEEYISALSAELSRVKRTILQELWNAGNQFPRNWVSSSRLLAITGQKYFDRRIREMRDELGCDIETEVHDGEHSYRLHSNINLPANPRTYLTATHKQQLFEHEEYSCKICGKKVQPGVKGLQADHKIPLIRGGSPEFGNWQSICNVCNVGKRRACEGCRLDCQQCPWAFPEKFGSVVVVHLPDNLLRAILTATGGGDKETIEKFIVNAVDLILRK